MSRYIEKEYIGSAVAHLPTKILQTEHGIELVVPVTDVIETIKNAPSIDIVRCQDCKYWVYNFNGCARNPCTEPWYATDFCSYGERSRR